MVFATLLDGGVGGQMEDGFMMGEAANRWASESGRVAGVGEGSQAATGSVTSLWLGRQPRCWGAN
jgi:hypothetical protein